MSRPDICLQHEGKMMANNVVKRYSEAFKIQIVREYESGTTLNKLNAKYGITGVNTVRQWVEKYSLEGLRHNMMVIQSPTEQQEVPRLRERIKQLEGALAQLTLDKMMLTASLEVAEKQLGHEVKKKTEMTSYRPPAV